MNKIIKSAAFVLLATPAVSAFAGSSSGCGLGAMVFEGQTGLMANVLAATTNNIIIPQTFAISTGTLGCDPENVVSNEYQRKVFVASNMDNLAQEMAQGQGDHLASLAELMGVAKEDKPAFYSFTQDQYASLFGKPDVDAQQMLASLDGAMTMDPVLSKYAK